MKRFHKRRYRQIGRLLYYYCCVRYMTRKNGRLVETMADCPFCNGNGELLINEGNDVLFCPECGGSGQISTLRHVKWIKEMGYDKRTGNRKAKKAQ